MPRLGAREWMFGVNCFVAAMLALYVSCSLGLDRPYWAMLTVYVTSQPLAGAVRSKALYRLLGTAVGATASILMVGSLYGSPELLSLALALWVGGCLFLSLLDRRPTSYLFMLAGYTAALIAFPNVGHPGNIFNLAALRVQEIGIGVVCAAFVHGIVFPRSVGAALTGQIRKMLADASRWSADALVGSPSHQCAAERRRFAADVTELHLKATHLPYDTAHFGLTRAPLTTLLDHFVLLLPLVTAIEDRLALLGGIERLAPEWADVLRDVAAWIGTTPEVAPSPAASLRARCAALEEQASAATDWPALLRLSLIARVDNLIRTQELCRTLVMKLEKPDVVLPPALSTAVSGRLARPLHRDVGIAAWSAVTTTIAILLCCAFWITSGWVDGSGAAMMAAIAGCLFATMDDPTPVQRSFLFWSLLSVPLAAVYVLAILPRIDGFPMLALAFAPVMIVGGACLAVPTAVLAVLGLVANMIANMALTPVFSTDFTVFINGSIAVLVGIITTLAVTSLLRVIGAARATRRLLRASRNDMATLVERPTAQELNGWTSRMLDRVGLLTLRMTLAGQSGQTAAADALRDMRIGFNIIALERRAAILGDGCELRVRRLVGLISAHFRALAKQPRAVPRPSLLVRLDETIRLVAGSGKAAETPAARREALAALTGLRRKLFPQERTYVPRSVTP